MISEYRYGNAIVKVYRPELTQGEREDRERRILSALQQFGKEAVKENYNGNSNKTRSIN